jgi:hypothetical protein
MKAHKKDRRHGMEAERREKPRWISCHATEVEMLAVSSFL